jgi:hypothetical protein
MFLGSPDPRKKWHLSAERPVLDQPLPDALEDDLLPVLGEIPVFLPGIELPHEGQVEVFGGFAVGTVVIYASAELHLRVQPALFGRGVIDPRQFFRFCCFV